jgi:hypothetical protein
MNQVFWIGLYPGIQGQILEYMVDILSALPESVGAVAS